MSNAATCPKCDRVLMGSARTCVVHGDQLDIGGHAPALETVADQRRQRSKRNRVRTPDQQPSYQQDGTPAYVPD